MGHVEPDNRPKASEHTPVVQIRKPSEIFNLNDLKPMPLRKTESDFNEYILRLPVKSPPTSNTFDEVTLTIWSKGEIPFDGFGDFMKMHTRESFLLCCGLASNPTEFDRKGVSFIKKFSESLNNLGMTNPVFFGLSCPGFTGSEIKGNLEGKISQKNVSALNYAYLIEYVQNILGLENSPLVGHSAGGEAALLVLSRLLNGENAWHQPSGVIPPVVALHPAINESGAGRFKVIALAEKLKKILPFGQDAVTLQVIKYLLTLPQFKHQVDAVKDQVYMHLEESKAHPIEYDRKLKELAAASPIKGTVRNNAHLIYGTNDRLTPKTQINENFTPKNPFYDLAYSLLSHGHDDIFINADVQQEAIDSIVGYLRRINYLSRPLT